MADTKITGLTENTTPVSTDIIPMVDDPSGTPVTQKVTMSNLRKAIVAGSDTQVQYNASGTLGGISNATSDGTTLSLTSPKIITGLNDTNGNELMKVTATGSAVNEITLANAATGGHPTISTTGSDTHISLILAPKGDGNFHITSASAAKIEMEKTGTGAGTASFYNDGNFNFVGPGSDPNRKFSFYDQMGAGNGGNISTPPFVNFNDLNTGMYFPSNSDELALVTGGTARLSINSSGKVTISGDLVAESTAKFWIRWTGGSTTILDDYNVDSVANTGTGDADLTITTDFANANWCGIVNTLDASANGWDADSVQSSGFNAIAAGTCGVLCGYIIDGGTAAAQLVNPASYSAVGFGDQ